MIRNIIFYKRKCDYSLYSKKDLLRLFGPAFIEQFLSTAIGVVNTMMVSGLGAYAVSAVGIVDSINFVAMNLFLAVSTGATVVIAQHLGAGNENVAGKTAAQSITAVAILSVASGLGLYIFGQNIIDFLFGNAEQAVKSAAWIYLICSAISYPLLGIFNAFTGILRANNNFRAPMIAVIASNLVNLLVGAYCIFYLDLGVWGAGIGLIFARLSGAIILIYPLFKSPVIKMGSMSYKMTAAILMPVLYIGIPAGLDSIIFNGGKLLVQTLVTSLGTASLAANSIASSVNSLINVPGNAMAIVAVTVVGHYAGSGMKDGLNRIQKKLMIYTMLLLGIVSIIIFLFAGNILSLYRPSAQVLGLALNVTHLTLICLPIFWPAAFILSASLRSAGDVVYVTSVSVTSMWIIRVFCAYLLVRLTGLGLLGVWIAWCGDWVCRGAFYYLRLVSRKYEKHLPEFKECP